MIHLIYPLQTSASHEEFPAARTAALWARARYDDDDDDDDDDNDDDDDDEDDDGWD